MSFDLQNLAAAVAAHGNVTRVVVAQVHGSTPREAGAAMLVWKGGQSGTIGGGALELDAARRALDGEWLQRISLGPALGQCCGGAVTLVAEIWNKQRLAAINGTTVVRRINGPAVMPLKIKALLKEARGSGLPIDTRLISGWLAEPVAVPLRHVWIYGAGHVGRAIVSVLSAIPEIAVTWIDSAPDRFPDAIPPTVRRLVAISAADVVKFAPDEAEHLVLTYSHALDMEICHRILGREFRRAGLIGSKTKWARFRRKLVALGHAEHQISRISCPIGLPELGKHPQAIAVGVVCDILSATGAQEFSAQRAG